MSYKSIFDTSYLNKLIAAGFEMSEFAGAMGVSEDRLSKLLMGDAEFKQSEMHAAAQLLALDAGEFERCFFTQKVQKIQTMRRK